MGGKQERPGLQAFAHRELDRFIAERIAEEEQPPRSFSRAAFGLRLQHGNGRQGDFDDRC
jgi:hypothetical protein